MLAKKLQWTPPFCFRQSFQVSLVCMHVRTLVYLFVCFPVLRACMLPEGKQAVWGVICFYRGWQLITNPDKHWGRGEGREGGEMTNEREREERRGEERRWRWAGGLAFEFHRVTTQRSGSCHHNLCMSLDLSWTTAEPPTWPTDN